MTSYVGKNSLKNVIFGVDPKKVLDNSEKVVDNKETEETSVVETTFEPNFKAYSIVKQDTKKYALLVVDVDLRTMQSKASIEDVNADNEAKVIVEMNKRLAEQSRGFRK